METKVRSNLYIFILATASLLCLKSDIWGLLHFTLQVSPTSSLRGVLPAARVGDDGHDSGFREVLRIRMANCVLGWC